MECWYTKSCNGTPLYIDKSLHKLHLNPFDVFVGKDNTAQDVTNEKIGRCWKTDDQSNIQMQLSQENKTSQFDEINADAVLHNLVNLETGASRKNSFSFDLNFLPICGNTCENCERFTIIFALAWLILHPSLFVYHSHLLHMMRYFCKKLSKC